MFIVLLLTLTTSFALAAPLTSKVAQSLVQIYVASPNAPPEATALCTGFSVRLHKFLTAAHCVEGFEKFPNSFIKVDGKPGTLLLADHQIDLALVESNDVDKPVIKISSDLARGDQVIAAGYGGGHYYPIFTTHVVESTNYSVSTHQAPGTLFVHPFQKGMSGGPIVNENGKVVSVVQASAQIFGFGANISTIKSFLKRAGINHG